MIRGRLASTGSILYCTGMAESDADLTDPRRVASTTFAYLRRTEDQLGKMMDVLLRHDTRLGRVERDLNEVRREIGDVRRDVGEVKGDIILRENKMLTPMNQILAIVQRVDEHQRQIEAIAPSE